MTGDRLNTDELLLISTVSCHNLVQRPFSTPRVPRSAMLTCPVGATVFAVIETTVVVAAGHDDRVDLTVAATVAMCL